VAQQFMLEDLAGRVTRQFPDEDHVAWHLVAGEVPGRAWAATWAVSTALSGIRPPSCSVRSSSIVGGLLRQ